MNFFIIIIHYLLRFVSASFCFSSDHRILNICKLDFLIISLCLLITLAYYDISASLHKGKFLQIYLLVHHWTMQLCHNWIFHFNDYILLIVSMWFFFKPTWLFKSFCCCFYSYFQFISLNQLIQLYATSANSDTSCQF